MSLLHELQVTLIETQEPKLRDLAMRLGNPKNQTEIRQRKLRKELYEVLGSIIDSESYYLIVMATKRIEKITNKITANVGWFASRKGITEIEGEIETYTEFPEIVKGRRLYHLDRDETGFHVQNDEVPSNGLLKSIREAEIKFAKEKKEELELLHQMYTIKENLMGGGYKVKPGYNDLAELICAYLGYPKKEEVITKE